MTSKKSASGRWLPVPECLLQDVIDAPTVTERDEAMRILTAWMVSFKKERDGQSCTVRKVASWSGLTRYKAHAVKARAVAWLKDWIGEPSDKIQTKSDKNQTDSGQSNDDDTGDVGDDSDKNQTDSGQESDTHTRAVITSTLQDTITDPPIVPQGTSAAEEPKAEKKTPAKSQAQALWEDLEAIRKEHTPTGYRKRKLTASLKRTLTARLKEHTAEDIKALWLWWLTSTHKRAGYLRENGYGPDTLLRASKCGEYVTMALQDSGGATGTTEGAQTAAKEAWSDLRAGRHTIQGRNAPDDQWTPLRKPEHTKRAMQALCIATKSANDGWAWRALRDTEEGYESNVLERAFIKAFVEVAS